MVSVYWGCLFYWILIIVLQYYRTNLEMVDIFGSIIYSGFIVFFVISLICSHIFKNNEIKMNILHTISAIPALITGVLAIFSLLSCIYYVTKI